MNNRFSDKGEEFSISHSKPCLTKADQSALIDTLGSRMIAEGEMVRKFEQAISQYLGLMGGVATSSGTDALFLALKALEIGNQDEVIIPTYVCRAVWDAVKSTGAEPVLCDIGEDWCVNPETVKQNIRRRTKAIIVVHTFGIMADVRSIGGLGIPVIEDCCQSLGVKTNGRMAGTFGSLCVLSFHATKLLTTGEGGMVLTKDVGLLEKLSNLKHGGKEPHSERYRMPLSDLQAAVGMSQLAQYDRFLQRRKLIADYYFDHLKELPIELPDFIRGRSIFFRFPLRIQRDYKKLYALFDAEGIQVRQGVDILLHRLFNLDPGCYSTAEKIFNETLSIPIYPALIKKERKRIVSSCYRNLKN